MRYDLGEEVYRRENGALRDGARVLSSVRDAAVLIQVHDDLVRAGVVPMTGLRRELVERHHDLRDQLLDGETLPELGESVAGVLARIETWPMASLEWDSLAAGLRRVYHRGRNAMAAAYEEPTTERFHQWRKRTRYLRHQLAFLKELWPEVMCGSAKSAHALTDVLGEAHDLAVLGQAAKAVGTDPSGAERLSEFIEARRGALRARAEPIGLRLYAEKPSRFVARLGHYWEAGVRQGVAA